MDHHIGYKLCEDYRIATFGNTVTAPIKFSACTLPDDIILIANDFGYNNEDFVIYSGNSITFKSDYWSYPDTLDPAINLVEFEIDTTSNPMLIKDNNSVPAFVFLFDANGQPIESQAIASRADQKLQQISTVPIFCHLLSVNKDTASSVIDLNIFEDYEIQTNPSFLQYSLIKSQEKCSVTPGTSIEPIHVTFNAEITITQDIPFGAIAFCKEDQHLYTIDLMNFIRKVKKDDVVVVESRVEVVYETGVILI